MVFEDRKFIVVRNAADTPQKYDALVDLIKANGGKMVQWDERADGNVSPKLVIVASSVDYERSEEMRRFMIPTVTDSWVHACISEQKLVPMRPFSPDPRNFMRDVIVCFSDLNPGDTDVFKAGIIASGGECSDIVTRYTSHVVATKLETPECDLVLQSQKNNPDVHIKLVKPDWLDACMSLKVKVDDTPYLLTLDPKSASGIHTSQTQDLTGTFPIRDSPRLAVQQSMREGLGSDILEGRKFFLADDLELSDRVGKTVNYLIETNGGFITSRLEDAQAYIGKWREGDQYIQASKQKLIIGNITWIYWVTIHQKFEKPNHLLHYPEVKGGLKSMRDFRICITNYTGDARAYLQSLIVSLGATYSGKLIENQSTHLVTAYESGQKYEAAKRWGIPVVNHLWLEDSYAYWHAQDPTSRLYTYLSPKLSMSTLIGTRNLVANVLIKFQKPEGLNTAREHHEKRQAKQKAGNWLHDAMILENEYHKKLKRGRPPPPLETDSDKEANESNETSREHTPVAIEDDSINSPHRSESLSAEVLDKVTKFKDVNNQVTRTNKKPKNQKLATEVSERNLSTELDSDTSRNSSPPPMPSKARRIMFSGIEEPPSSKACNRIGLQVVKTAPVRLLVAPRYLKTVKFLQCLASCEDFVMPSWIEACIQSKSLLPTDRYRIDDKILSEALESRDKLNGQGLFENLVFRLDPGLKKKSTAFRDLVKAHKGSMSSTKSVPGTIVVGSHEGQVPFETFIDSIYYMNADKLRDPEPTSS